jgi:hypothetical protein
MPDPREHRLAAKNTTRLDIAKPALLVAQGWTVAMIGRPSALLYSAVRLINFEAGTKQGLSYNSPQADD